MKLKTDIRPEDKSTDYQFFTNEETGNRFKVKIAATDAAAMPIGSATAANTQFGVCITTSLIDGDNKALSENGLPVIDSLTHTFTDVEISEPGFSLPVRVAAIVSERIEALERRTSARQVLDNINAAWAGGPINLEGVE